ncbi:hypothetical protein GPECTOR_57g482 [Gonium pectorale]|uniref:EF-hand domain-containing protein n=1 Tax=Gonium pectorale TaxID=33097 RepID=A0A150G5R3_GONPE|nr:hypothetical protein GPECTOR_57g482 [Gonium pectorale]|eukprot:KXZ45192.1 hypothetical protein GPECTOR_57g482 [Gonium pectorale]
MDLEAARLWFQSVDTNRSGHLDAHELKRALEMGRLNYTLHQVHQFIRVFDYQGDKKLDVNEFIQLHRFLCEVQDCFAAVGRGSPLLPAADLPTALARMGHQLEPQAMQAVLVRFDVSGRGGLALEDFLSACFFLMAARRVFYRFDPQQSGRATFDFNQFCYAAAHLP